MLIYSLYHASGNPRVEGVGKQHKRTRHQLTSGSHSYKKGIQMPTSHVPMVRYTLEQEEKLQGKELRAVLCGKSLSYSYELSK